MILNILNIDSKFKLLDTYTQQHSFNVAFTVFDFGRYLNLSSEEVKNLTLAALWHDIGKTEISAYILKKKEPLTKEEYEMVKAHSVKGEEILNSLYIPREISFIVRHHHECFNGTGYPDGLTGQDIPYCSRILAVVDAFDAMTTDRPYRKKLNSLKALEEIINNSQTQFDPYIVYKFVEFKQIFSERGDSYGTANSSF